MSATRSVRNLSDAVQRKPFGVVVVLALVALPAVAQPKVEVIPQTKAPPRVTAVGSAAQSVQPDIAVLTFGVEIRDPSTTNAVLVNERMTKKVVAALQKEGVPAGSVSVAPYEMEHVVDTFIPALGTNQPVEFQIQQKGTYKVTRTITVTTHAVAKVDQIVSAALAAGVDRIGPVRYRSSRRQAIEQSLVAGAIADARKRAQQLAADSGLTLGEPLQVASIENPGPPAEQETMPQSPPSTNVPELTITTHVRVVFAATKAGG